jgi:beta-phosphoglucomutase
MDSRPLPNRGTPKRAVIWDVDGTLVDTAELHFRAWMALAAELNKPFDRADFGATFGLRNPEILRQLFDTRYTETQVAELGERKESFYRALARAGVGLLPGVGRLLESLREAGFVQAIGSSAPRANLDLILDLTGTAPFFSAVVSMEDTSRGKPDPQVFQLAATRLQTLPAHCVVMEDAPAGVVAAKAGGMKCIAVTYVGPHSKDSLRNAGADQVVQTFGELTAASVRSLVDSDQA